MKEFEELKRISVRLPPNLKKKVEDLAKKERRTFNSQIIFMLEKHFNSNYNI